MNTALVKLHEHEDLLNDVAKLLNSEWPRSETARLRSLNDSEDNLPCSVVLVEKLHDRSAKNRVIGHSKLCKVHGKHKSAFIENVIIEKRKRGCGLGKKLMELSEDYAHKLGYQDLYLSTHDKCQFYEHLGYQYSCSVSPVRANAKLLTPEQFSALQLHFGEQKEHLEEENTAICQLSGHQDETNSTPHQTEMQSESKSQKNKIPDLPPLPPPPPPPFVTPLGAPSFNSNKVEKQFWMVKHLEIYL